MRTQWGYTFSVSPFEGMWNCDECHALTFSPIAHSEWHIEQKHRIDSAGSVAWVD